MIIFTDALIPELLFTILIIYRSKKMDIDTILKVIEDNAIDVIRFEETDITGMPIGKDIPTRLFRKRVENGIYMNTHVLFHNYDSFGIYKGKFVVSSTFISLAYPGGGGLRGLVVSKNKIKKREKKEKGRREGSDKDYLLKKLHVGLKY